MASITLDLSGDKALIGKLEAIEGRITILAGRVLKSAARPILARAQAEAPVGETSATKNALILRKATSRKGRVRVVVQETAQRGMPFYVPFAMLGHKAGSRALGDARKQVPGNQFMQHAFDAEAPGAMVAIESGLRDEIEKAAKSV